MPPQLRSVIRLLIAACVVGWLPWATSAQAPPSTTAPSSLLAIDIRVVDATGRVPDVLTPADVTVTVAGRVRPVRSVRRVSHGPGAAADAEARHARGAPGMIHVAEPSRTVLMVVDESSILLGDERQAIQVAAAFLDGLGINDRVAVIRLPLVSNRIPAPTAERPPARGTINHIVGRIPPEPVVADGITPDDRHLAGDPMGDRINRAERPEPPPRGGTTAGDSLLAPRDSLDGLIRVLRSAASQPGRKLVAFFSAGLDDGASGRVGDVVRAAAEARASIYAFGLRSRSDSRHSRLDPKLLGRLAAATGGTFVTIGRNPVSDVDALAPELAASFLVGVDGAAEDERAGVLPLRVESPRAGLIVRAASVVAPGAPAAEDVEPRAAEPTAAAVGAPSDPGEYRGAGRLSPAPAPPTPASPKSPQLTVALGRLIDYAYAYIGQYSAIVAEEDYKQSVSNSTTHLRSDLLFVKAEPSREWVSFRDVYEVDGVAVRDRDDRLKTLFLTPSPDAQAQLRAIKDESARYNIGPFERNINVPLYPLKFLLPANRNRFEFSGGRASSAAGARTWQIDVVERARPTLVHDRDGRDIPLKGRFVVEQATGAIVETTVTVQRRDYTVVIVVRYGRDPKLGLWVPSEMKETYRIPQWVGVIGGANPGPVLEGVARLSKFRRFQVTTEERSVPK